MLKLSIPGFKEDITIHHLALDFNGTLAIDGKLIKGVKDALISISKKVNVHVLTGDTHGTAKEELKGIPCEITLLPKINQAIEKQKNIRKLKPATVIAIGNGRNDLLMLKTSAIGIIVVQKEGASAETLMAADIVCPDILTALGLINNPSRLIATLRK
ncbi:MAG TPA: HAD hydrolase family protein [Bacteroidia bacterium]|jgi:P-type E1-E2 ATPase|nr:HAD hydrolase family protein [Bacteroidia bacterium]